MVGTLSRTTGQLGRRLWRTVHLWLALAFGLIIAFIGITGSLSQFNRSLFELEYGDMVRPRAEVPAAASLDTWIAAAQAAHPELLLAEIWAPGGTPLRINVPMVVGHAVDAQGKPVEPETHYVIVIDPRNSSVPGSFVYEESLASLPLNLHMSLLLPIGPQILAVVAIAIMISILTGLYLWWPRNRHFLRAVSIPRAIRANTLRDWHNILGFWVAVPLFMVAFTGLWIVMPSLIEPIARRMETPPAGRELPRPSGSVCTPVSATAALSIAQKTLPAATWTMISWPQDEDIYSVRMRAPNDPDKLSGSQYVEVSRSCGHVHSVWAKRPGPVNWLREARITLHRSLMLGLAGETIMVAIGLLLPAFFVTGVLMWLRRRRNEAEIEKRRRRKT